MLNEKFINILKTPQEELFEFSNLIQVDTGLPMIVWASVKNHSSGCRIKVQNNTSSKIDLSDSYCISVSDNPEVVSGVCKQKKYLTLVRRWIMLNKEILLRYWNMEISTKEMLITIKSL